MSGALVQSIEMCSISAYDWLLCPTAALQGALNMPSQHLCAAGAHNVVELSLHSLCLLYHIAKFITFLVDIWICKGRCIRRPYGHSLTMDVVAGGLGWLAHKTAWTGLKVLMAI